MDFIIRLPIAPRGKRTPHPIVVGKRVNVGGRVAVVGAFAKATKDPGTRDYEREIAALVLAAAPPNLAPLPCYALDVLAILPPTQAMESRRRTGPLALVWAPVKPDADNVVKSAQDALTMALRHILGDDARCVLVRAGKLRQAGTEPAMVVRVYSPDRAPPPWLLTLADATCAPDLGWRSLDGIADDLGGPE